MVKKYQKLPVIIEAIEYTGENLHEIVSFVGKDHIKMADSAEPRPTFDAIHGFRLKYITTVYIVTLEGDMEISVGDFVIRGVRGEHYPCKPDIFWKTYKEYDENDTDNCRNCDGECSCDREEEPKSKLTKEDIEVVRQIAAETFQKSMGEFQKGIKMIGNYVRKNK